MSRVLIFILIRISSLVLEAQTLPRLDLGVASNQQVVITWPYTNAGFIFQEARSLSPATNWQASAFAPRFDSNLVRFSVSAPPTNVAQFFRLAQSADLRGLYVYSSDVSSISAGYAQTLSNALSVPGVDGLVLVVAWAALEPANRVFHWTNLDLWMNRAALLGKKVDLAILAGQDTPAWLFEPVSSGGPGVTPLHFTVSPHSGRTGNCISETNAAPWDANFLASWDWMLNRLSNHLKTTGAYSNVTLLRLTGINRTTDELRLPAETAASTGLDCVSNAPAIWQAAGYTPANLLAGWSNILNSFTAYFPDKTFSVAIIPNNAFPPIDDNGQIITKDPPDANQPLLSLAAQKLPGRFVVQYNFLMTTNPANPAVVAAAQKYGTLVAYQSNNYFGSSGGGAACGGEVTNPVACLEATYLDELRTGIYPLTAANGLRSQYIEVFPANVLALTNAIWQAHTELLGGP